MKTIVMRMCGSVRGQSDEFTHALWLMTKERGGGYMPVVDVEARAATLQVVERLKLPPLPPPVLPPLLPPLPIVLPPLP